jgi:hypothetical protein
LFDILSDLAKEEGPQANAWDSYAARDRLADLGIPFNKKARVSEDGQPLTARQVFNHAMNCLEDGDTLQEIEEMIHGALDAETARKVITKLRKESVDESAQIGYFEESSPKGYDSFGNPLGGGYDETHPKSSKPTRRATPGQVARNAEKEGEKWRKIFAANAKKAADKRAALAKKNSSISEDECTEDKDERKFRVWFRHNGEEKHTDMSFPTGKEGGYGGIIKHTLEKRFGVKPRDILKMTELNESAIKKAKKADKDYDGDGKIESPKDEVWGSRMKAAKKAGKMEEGLGDVVKGIKRKIAGKEDPKEVEHLYGRIARSAIKHKTDAQADKAIKNYRRVNKVVYKEGVDEEVAVEGSGSKEKQKTPYRNINSPEYRAAADKQRQKMAKDKASEPGKKLLSKIGLKGGQSKMEESAKPDFLDIDKDGNKKEPMKKAAKEKKVSEEAQSTRYARAEKAGRKVAKDIEWDEKHKDKIHGKRRGSEDDKAEKAGRKVTRDIEWDEKHKRTDEGKPSAGLSKEKKSEVVKSAKSGKDIGKKGKGFEKIAKSAGGGEKGQKIAANVMWKNIKREAVGDRSVQTDESGYQGKGNHKPGWMLKADPALGKKVKDAKNAARPPISKPSKEKGDEKIDEKAKSKNQQKFMGMVHAAQKGEKPASKAVGAAAKSMKKSDVTDFAKTKHEGLPKKVKETASSGSTGGCAIAPTVTKLGEKVTYGAGVYEEMDKMFMKSLDEGINVNVNIDKGAKVVTANAEGEDADTLTRLLNLAGIDQGMSSEPAGFGGMPSAAPMSLPAPAPSAPISIGGDDMAGGFDDFGDDGEMAFDVVGENQPDWPTNAETSSDPFQYSGGLNKPKVTGQTTTPIIAGQNDRTHSIEESVNEIESSLMRLYKVFNREG